MKKWILKSFGIIVFTIILSSCGNKEKEEGAIVLEGKYNGKNIFIQNPFGPDGIGFCINQIMVNGKITSDEINATSCEIDFTALPVKQGDNIKVEILHKKGCSPKVLNPEVLK